MNYWLHRITGGGNSKRLSYPLFEKGYLSIGFSELSDEESLSELKSDFDNTIQKRWDAHLPRTRWNLWRFINEMKAGDLVVVPFPYEFAICRISDDTIYTNETIDKTLLVDWNQKEVKLKDDGYLYSIDDNCVELGFYRKIEVIAKNLSRWDYADQALYSRLKILQTNSCINDIKESVEKAIDRAKNRKPINLKNSIIDSTYGALLEQINELSNDSKFEDLVQGYLKTLGGRIYAPNKNESSTQDGDADVIAFFDHIEVAIMVQVKKHDGTTNDWAVNQIKAYRKNHQYDEWKTILWVISSCDKFSDEAIKLAEENEVRLINGENFSKMILEAGLSWIPQ